MGGAVLSCRTEPLTCGLQHYLQEESVRIELNGRTHSWYWGIVWGCGENPTQVIGGQDLTPP